MKKNALALGVAFLVSACGHQYRVDSRLESTVQRFRELSKQYGNEQRVDDVTIDVVPHGSIHGDNKVLGYCDGGGEIQIDENLFYMSPSQQELVVFHELGHCVLGRDHNSDLNNGMPTSIMHPAISDMPYAYESHPEPYWDELFH